MIKTLILFAILSIAFYMLYAFANWDIAWIAHVGMIARWFFVLFLALFYLMWVFCFL